jgi:hypothetical protein
MYINLVLLFFVTLLLKINTKRKRLANLGKCAPTVRSVIPFGTSNRKPSINCQLTLYRGLDVLIRAVKQIHADQFFEWGREILDVPGRTVELRMLGLSIIMTDNPANVKTVLSAKVRMRNILYCIV